MSGVGLKIMNPHDGTHFVFNKDTAPATLTWVANVDNHTPGANERAETWTCPVKIPSGYKSAVAAQRMAGVVFYYDGDNFRINGGEEFCDYIQNGETVTIKNIVLKNPFSSVGNIVKIIAYPHNQTGKAGLKIGGNVNFNVDIPHSGFSYVSHKATLKIEGRVDFSKIDPRLNLGNCLAFFHTDDPYAMISLYRRTNTDGYDLYYACTDRRNGNRTSATFRVIIFSDVGAEGRFGNERYGLRLRNSRGQITFSSGVGVLTRPTEVFINAYKQNERIVVPGIARPMYIPSMVGEHFWVSDRKGYIQELCVGNYDAGSICIGASMVDSKPGYLGSVGYGTDYTYITQKPVLILDASDYFHF
ncbi:hypothetical protein Xmau_00710 [Xenorhabdus mauleonii]|uniref:Uncharacterized protein n=1 Tax=Xenorhabdus mauleonii TaxID=351675 RepID=A0A1I3JS62_9GAMM|nr:hypothetical protein Xmau_00710 [Xenorhabdus mauleonii]SFI63077.1 hypothetical protein SAMN05421680_102304 [Xenorhabdus mauleonii]